MHWARKFTPRNMLLSEIGWPTLANRRQYFKLILFFKMINRTTPSYLSELIPRIDALPTISVRNRRCLRQIRFKTQQFGKSFIPSTIKLWNDLPLDIRESLTVDQFKHRLKNTLLSIDYVPEYYSYGLRSTSILHAQLRLSIWSQFLFT